MNHEYESGELANLEHKMHKPRSGLWRPLYARIVQSLGAESVAEVGAGSPDLLTALDGVPRRVAIDSGIRWQDDFLSAGIDFQIADLNAAELPRISPVDIVVCTDVLEHLLFPRRVLSWISDSLLQDDGLLITHVPNEFTFRRNMQVMMGRRDAVYFHPDADEDEDPHLRRFTDIGFHRLLERSFKHNRKFSHLVDGRAAQWFRRCGITVPFCFQPGPGYVSTNSDATDRRAREIIASIPSRGVGSGRSEGDRSA